MSIFNSIKVKPPKRSTHNLSFTNVLTAKFGELTPFMCQEVLPGDKWKVGEQHLIRLAPTIHPLMHNVNVFMHYFFVPNRLIWSNWEKFIAGESDSNGKFLHTAPYMELKDIVNNVHEGELVNGSLCDYLGVPTVEMSKARSLSTSTTKVSSLPFRAYQTIYNEYFRDQNIISDLEINKDTDGKENSVDIAKLVTMRRRSWHKDYFTSALPNPQLGTQILLPINGDVPLQYVPDGYTYVKYPYTNQVVKGDRSLGTQADGGLSDEGGNGVVIDNHQNLKGVLNGNASMPSVQDMRRAYRLQEFMEKQMRTGSRYIEMLLAFFGVHSSDARLQRPEYLSGVKCPIIMSEVQQTSSTTDDSALGGLAGNGTSVNSTNTFSRRFEEHGFIIGIMSVMPKASYYQGIPRKLSRLKDRFDYFWPDFEHIGEQEIKNQELFHSFEGGTDGQSDNQYNEGTFGYAPRYSEYKYNPDEVHGEFRDSLSSWHLGRKFSNRPHLNRSFLEYDNSNVDNVLAVSQDIQAPLYVQIYNHIIVNRPMSKYGEPRL